MTPLPAETYQEEAFHLLSIDIFTVVSDLKSRTEREERVLELMKNRYTMSVFTQFIPSLI